MITAERQYLNLVQKIINEGEVHENRTGIDTRRLWVETIRHDMATGFPLLTTKKMAIKACFTEMLGFIRGEMDIRWYQERGCKIWNADHARWHGKDLKRDQGLVKKAEASYEIRQSVKHRMSYPNSLGEIYGAQWRDLGGFDQLKWILGELRNRSNSRRLIMSAWNPAAFPMMCLPPCHIMYHFSVRGEYLDVAMTQRSCDTGLGVPFNIAGTGLLLAIMAHCSDLTPGKMVWTGNDVHIYENQIEGLKGQLMRIPYDPPRLHIVADAMCDPWEIEPEDLLIENYQHHDAIKLPLSVG